MDAYIFARECGVVKARFAMSRLSTIACSISEALFDTKPFETPFKTGASKLSCMEGYSSILCKYDRQGTAV